MFALATAHAEIPILRRPTPERVAQAIEESGCVLLPGIVPQEVIRPLATAVQAMLDHYDRIPREVLDTLLAAETPETRDRWRQAFDDGTHYNGDLVAFSAGKRSLFEPYHRSPLKRLIEGAFPDRTAREHFCTNVRRVSPPLAKRPGEHSDQPLLSHVDAMFHEHASLLVNCWTPLTPGAGSRAPGLSVVPLSVEETKRVADYRPEGHPDRSGEICYLPLFDWQGLAPERLKARDIQFVSPVLNPGDVLLFTNFTIHKTNVRPGMTASRTSIEVRIRLEPKT